MLDIIICVHNALEDVKKCIESVRRNTEGVYQIIIIDDGSDEETKGYLEHIERKYNNILRIRNEKGNGYTKAVNMGIRVSTGEYIVLINSDTIVTAGWINKLINAFNENKNVGVVGPVSNVASWQSVPRIKSINGDWLINELPPDVSLDKYVKLIDKYIKDETIEVPLLNGFCLLVKKEVFLKVGLFDEVLFEKGYGEENDFNIRVGDAGYKLVIVPNCYIYHAQSKSYSDNKRLELCALANKTLQKKYGCEFIEALVDEIKDNYRLASVRSRVKAMIEREWYLTEGRKLWTGKRVLILLTVNSANGGANVVIQEATKMREMGVDVCFYNLYENKDVYEKAYADVNIPVIYGVKPQDFLECADMFDLVCATYHNTLQYFKEIKTKKAYYIQDYEPWFFEKNSREYQLAYDSYTAEKDIVCVTKTKWNANIVKENHNIECEIIGPSVNIDLYRPIEKKKDGRVRICAMIRPSTPRRAANLTMRVLKEISRRYEQKVEIHIFGADPDVEAEFFANTFCDFKHVNHGRLRREKVCDLLQNVDIFLDLSVFQAMGLTAMEAMACGCAVVMTNNGGTGEFGKNTHNCLMVEPSDNEEILNAIQLLLEDDKFRKNISINAIKEITAFSPEKAAYLFLKSVFPISEAVSFNQKNLIPHNVFPKKLMDMIKTDKKIFIYGAGNYARIYASFLSEENILFEGFVVSSKANNPESLLDHPVYGLEEFINMIEVKDEISVIVAIASVHADEIKDNLDLVGFKNVYVHENN